MDKTFSLKEFMNHLRGLIKEPPYLMFIFISSTLLIVSLIWQENYIRSFLILLIYSMAGVVWRHAIKDFRGRIKELYDKTPEKFNKINLWLTGIYQLINLVLVIILVIVLKDLRIWR